MTNGFFFQSLMDQYFGRMKSLTNNKELPARIRFLLQNTIELRENNWVPRKAYVDNGPKTICQVRQDAVKVCFQNFWGPFIFLGLTCNITLNNFGLSLFLPVFWLDSNVCLQDLGVFIPHSNDGLRTDFFMDNSFLPTRVKFDKETIGGLADMFGQMPGNAAVFPLMWSSKHCITNWRYHRHWLVMFHVFFWQEVALAQVQELFRTIIPLPWVVIAQTRFTMAIVELTTVHISLSLTQGANLSSNQIRYLQLCGFYSSFWLGDSSHCYYWLAWLMFPLWHLFQRVRIHQCSTINRISLCRCSPRIWLQDSLRKGSSMLMRYNRFPQ